jgi:guanyl-specific ribonuclease Sa
VPRLAAAHACLLSRSSPAAGGRCATPIRDQAAEIALAELPPAARDTLALIKRWTVSVSQDGTTFRNRERSCRQSRAATTSTRCRTPGNATVNRKAHRRRPRNDGQPPAAAGITTRTITTILFGGFAKAAAPTSDTTTAAADRAATRGVARRPAGMGEAVGSVACEANLEGWLTRYRCCAKRSRRRQRPPVRPEPGRACNSPTDRRRHRHRVVIVLGRCRPPRSLATPSATHCLVFRDADSFAANRGSRSRFQLAT